MTKADETMLGELGRGHARLVERVADAMAADHASEVAFEAGDNAEGWQSLARAAIHAIITEDVPTHATPRA